MARKHTPWLSALVVLVALCPAALGQDEGPDIEQVDDTPLTDLELDRGPADGRGSSNADLSEGVDLQAPSISAEEIDEAIRLKIDYLYSIQRDEGHWENHATREEAIAEHNKQDPPRGYLGDRDWGGRSALVVLALLYGGEDYKNDRITKCLKILTETEFKGTYVCGIRASMWSKIGDRRFRRLLQTDAQYLLDAATTRDDKINGFFTYTKPGRGSGDHSNTQYGVLGLRDAALQGVEVPMEFWKAVEDHMILLQYEDGGWAYRTAPNDRSRPSYGNMTVACLANLYITHERLQALYRMPCFKGRIRVHPEPAAIEQGKAWLDRRLPGLLRRRGANLYFLYGLERCANASGRKTFGGVNWFEEGAKQIIRSQRPDGSHGGYRGTQVGTSWALLFLSKGRGAILFNKLDTGYDWNSYPLDIPNLSNWCGKELEQRINYQVVDLDEDVRTWLDAPVLYFNGQDELQFTEEEKKKLRLYTDSGGMLVAEAVCSSRDFIRSFFDLAKEVWPEWELQRLDARHPMLSSHYEIKGVPRRIFHLHDGCRTRVMLIAEDMSCAWHQKLSHSYPNFFRFGMNLARYASDKKLLKNRLTFVPWELDELRKQGKPVPQPPLEVARCRLVDYPTDGLRRTDIRALRHLRETCDMACNVKLSTEVRENHDLGDLSGVQIVHMSGHHGFRVSQENLKKLRKFIDDGGLIWADAQCGREAFDPAFRQFVKELLPEAQLKDTLAVDPLLTGNGLERPGFDMTRVRFKRALQFDRFEADFKEVRLDGRRVILYSPHDLTCGLDGHDCYACRGPVRNDCLKLGANIVLSALAAPSEVTEEQEEATQPTGPINPFLPGEVLPIEE